MQWPLFLAGIETKDPIHQEWIMAHMQRDSLRVALKRTLQIQKHTGCRLSMAAVRDTLAPDSEGQDASLLLTGVMTSTDPVAEQFDDEEVGVCLW